MISHDFVQAVYRAMLGRAPESDRVVEDATRSESEHAYLAAVMEGAEFRQRHPALVPQSRAWVWAEADEKFILRVNLADSAIAWPAVEGRFEVAETAFIKSSLRPGARTLDIGANVGHHTMLMASIVGPGGHVTSFEPLPQLLESVLMSVARNGFDPIVSVHGIALSDRTGEIEMRYATETNNWGGAQIRGEGELQAWESTISVPTRTVDALDLGPVDFIKIDIEGAEPKAISGAKALLGQSRPIVLSEVHRSALAMVSQSSPDDYVGLFDGLGYRCHTLSDPGQLGEAYRRNDDVELQNVVFIPAEFESVDARHAAMMLGR